MHVVSSKLIRKTNMVTILNTKFSAAELSKMRILRAYTLNPGVPTPQITLSWHISDILIIPSGTKNREVGSQQIEFQEI
jgi:hypothetical protein